jgi:hypothetical protein
MDAWPGSYSSKSLFNKPMIEQNEMGWNRRKALTYSVYPIVSVTFYKEQDQNESTETVPKSNETERSNVQLLNYNSIDT